MHEAFHGLDEIIAARPSATYRKRGWWGRSPLWERVREAARGTPERLAVADEMGVWSYGELWTETLGVARALQRSDVEKGDAIMVQLPNWREFVATVLGAEVAGVAFGFSPIGWGPRETIRGLQLVRPRLWITAGHYRGADRTDFVEECRTASGVELSVLVRAARTDCREGVKSADEWLRSSTGPVDEDVLCARGGRGGDPLEIAVTSGTTGDPKGVVHLHDTATAAIDSTIERQGIGKDDVIHVALPVGHTFGYFYGVRCGLQAGAAVVLQERWDAEQMGRLAERYRITVSMGPTAFLVDLLEAPANTLDALKKMKLFTQSGDPLPKPVAERARKILPFRISRALGMTEFGHVTSTDAASSRERIVDSAGSPQPEIEIKVVDDAGQAVGREKVGRILVSGPFVCAGYLTSEGVIRDVVDREGYFDTGDLGLIDSQGYLHVTGRLKNVIRRGAVTIPAADLENVLAAHDAVAHAVVIGRPHPRLGEVPVACVQLRPGTCLTLEEVCAAFEKQGITRQFWPDALLILDAWPRGATDKIDRGKLIEMAADL